MLEIITVYWIKILATLGVFCVLIILFLRSSFKNSKTPGAELVKKELDLLGENYKVFSNVIIKSDRGMLRIDYVVVSKYGVFVLTRCDLVGKISGHKNDRDWKIKAKDTDDTILNPLWENREHINALEREIGSQPFIPAVVFTHAKLVNDFGPIAVNVGQLQSFFFRYRKMLITLDNLGSVIIVLNEITD